VIYSYYFFAVAWVITLGLVLLFCMSTKSRSASLKIAFIVGATIAFSIPFVRASLRGQSEKGQTYLLERMGAYTHRPDLLALAGGVLLAAGVFVLGKNLRIYQPTYLVLSLLVAGSILGMNIQILTGVETQPWHFWKRLAIPLCFFIAASVVAQLLEQRWHGDGRLTRIVRALLAIVIVNAGARQLVAGINAAPYQKTTNSDVVLLRWVDHNLPPDHVIGTVNPDLILLTPALTNEYTYVPSGLRSLTSTPEIIARYTSLGCLLELSPERMKEDARVLNHGGISNKLLHVLGLSFVGEPNVFQSFVDQYRSRYRNCSPAPLGRVDYVVLRAGEAVPKRLAATFPSVHLLYENADYKLVALNR
jgi:hypothetical protein